MKPRLLDIHEDVLNDSVKIQDNNLNTFDRNKDEDKRKNTIEFDYLTRDKEQIIAMSVIGAKIVQFDVPFEEAKRELTGLKLLCFILGSLLSASADEMLGQELEGFGIKEKRR